MTGQRRRFGFTLIELLVVISIIAILLALTAIFFPNFQRREGVASGADSTAGALLTAKMRAKRDGRPTGVRLAVNPNAGVNANQYNMLQFIQQPDDFAQGRYVSASSSIATFTGVSFTGNVNPGDYLELNGGGLLYQIAAVTTNTLIVADPPASHPLVSPSTDVSASAGTNYRVIRAPQVLASEPTVNLPTGVIFDFGSYPNASPLSVLPTSTAGNLDILFAPSGGLVGAGLNSPVFLVLRQADGMNNNPTAAT